MQTDFHRLLVRYRPMLLTLARRYASPTNETDDLLQVGRIAVWKAVPAYDPSMGPLSTFLHRCIANAMYQEVTLNNGLVHIPRNRRRTGERRHVRYFSSYSAGETSALAAHAYDRWRKLHTYLSSC